MVLLHVLKMQNQLLHAKHIQILGFLPPKIHIDLNNFFRPILLLLQISNCNNLSSHIMESLIKQTRSRFSSNKEERSSTTERAIPPQKTQSFREKRSQSWIKRQFSRQMSWDYDFSGSDYPTAVAAAAYAIQSLKESKPLDRKERTNDPYKTLSKMKSKIEDKEEKIEPLKSALKSSDETSKTSFKDSDSTSMSKRVPEKNPSIKKRVSFSDEIDETSSNKPEKSAIEKPPEKTTSFKRTTSGDEQLDITESRRPGTPLPKPNRPPDRQPTTVGPRKQIATKSEPGNSAADAWEKQELASIKERYEKLRARIDDWEMKKKNKAKRKIERIEAELGKRKVKAIQKYHSDVTRIEGIAGGTKAQAEENRRNEEFKVKEKANKIRATGKLPPTCLCF